MGGNLFMPELTGPGRANAAERRLFRVDKTLQQVFYNL
jgi:hypothetical protein